MFSQIVLRLIRIKVNNVYIEPIIRSAANSTVFGGREATRISPGSGASAEGQPEEGSTRMEKISKAMKSYLERAEKQESFLEGQRAEYQLGKRHLANMMGWDPETVTQKDIDLAIEYLMPSGLFNPPARPKMKPPEELYPKQKEAQFDIMGRPFHTLFYTGLPAFFQTMHDLHANLLKLNDFEDRMIKQGIVRPPPDALVDLSGSEWISYLDLKAMLMEKISENHYNYMIKSLEKVTTHPYSAKCKEFFMKYRKELVAVTSQMEVLPLTYTEEGRPFMAAEGLRKHCVAQVTVWGKGSGLLTVNGEDLLYFPHFNEREQIMFPLQFTGLLNKVDVEATVRGSGVAAQAGAVRHGISLALKSFVESPLVEEMRLAGLLTKDRRVRERKKPGQPRARRKYTWKKR